MNIATNRFDNSWVPVRRGEVYCSTACGGGKYVCTWTRYLECKTKSKALAKRLGKGWTPRVHENLGWHWAVTGPSGYLYVLGDGRHWTALLDDKPDSYAGRWTGSGKTPEQAIANVLALFEGSLVELRGVRVALETAKLIGPIGPIHTGAKSSAKRGRMGDT